MLLKIQGAIELLQSMCAEINEEAQAEPEQAKQFCI